MNRRKAKKAIKKKWNFKKNKWVGNIPPRYMDAILTEARKRLLAAIEYAVVYGVEYEDKEPAGLFEDFTKGF